MRSINYQVKANDGSIFNTFDYQLATSNGNRIVSIFFTEVKEVSEKAKKIAAAHRAKINHVYTKKRF